MGAVMMSQEMKPPGTHADGASGRASSTLAGLVRDLGAAIAAGLTPHYLRCVLRLRSRAVADAIHSLAQFTCELEADAAADTAAGNLIAGPELGDAQGGRLVLTRAQRRVHLLCALMRQVTAAVLSDDGTAEWTVVDLQTHSRN